jgi:putative effector of murein hydrolase LrgA (UPF0299 family)
VRQRESTDRVLHLIVLLESVNQRVQEQLLSGRIRVHLQLFVFLHLGLLSQRDAIMPQKFLVSSIDLLLVPALQQISQYLCQ